MPILDASVVAHHLMGGRHAELVGAILAGERSCWAPHLIDAEVGHVMRKAVLHGGLPEPAAASAMRDLIGLPLVRTGHTGLVERAWELRDNLSFYDGLYVALAERVRGPLVTLDARLGRAAAELVDVEVLAALPLRQVGRRRRASS